MKYNYEQAEKKNSKCPLCGAIKFLRLAEVDRYGMGIRTVTCGSCGFITTDPMLSEMALDQFYKEKYRYVYSKVVVPSEKYISKNGIDSRAEYVADFVVANSNAPFAAKILDVGCAEGSVLRAVRR